MGDFSKEDIKIIVNSGLFDADWYVKEYPDVGIVNIPPFDHYIKIGRLLGRRPFRDFDPEMYLTIHEDVRRAGVDPFLHYAKSGHREGRKLSEVVKEVAKPVAKPVDKDYEAIRRSGFFDREWYIETYKSEVGTEDPISHYLRIGAKQGFDPSPDFSTSGYLDIYRDIKAAGVNPFLHYVKHGYKEGRMAKPAPRRKSLGLQRITPEETGTPNTILKFDSPPLHVPGLENERIAVHVHLFHTNMAEDVAHALCNIRHPFTLLVSVQEDQSPEYWTAFFESRIPSLEKVVVRALPNRGRDVAPWVVGFRDLIVESTIFCHIHSKRSDHNRSHGGWFRYLCHTLLGSLGVVDGILEILQNDKNIGVVSPCYFWTLANQPNYGKNKDAVDFLYKKLGGDKLPDLCPDYPAGSFFWCRTSVLEPLFALDLKLEDFAEEGGQVDGTIAHGIERIIGFLPLMAQMTLHMVTVDCAYDLTRYVGSSRTRLAHSIKRKPRRTSSKPVGSAVIYTCVSGGYESIIPVADPVPGVDMVLFTDNPNAVAPDGFQTRLSNYIHPQPVRTARFVKTHPHIWFQDHDYAIWCDSNVHFYGDLSEYIDRLEASGADCLFIAHPVRESIKDEANELIEKRILQDRELAEKQVQRYLKDENLLHARMIESNFFICKPKLAKTAKFMNTWWSEINKYTHRDQLSINYAIEQAKIKWEPLLPFGYSARNHDDFVLFAHGVERRNDAIDFIGG